MTKQEKIELAKHIQDMCYDVLNLKNIYLLAKKIIFKMC